MVDVNIAMRSTEGADDSSSLLIWDTVWNPDTSTLDWALAGTTDPNNLLGLQATRALDTAIMIQLATHKRAPSYMPLPSGTDPKGWWGDYVDREDNETELGSWLWLLYRSALTDETAQQALSYVNDCLKPLKAQGAVARFDVSVFAHKAASRLEVTIDGYSQDGQLAYSQRFARLWQQEFSTTSKNNGPEYYGSMG